MKILERGIYPVQSKSSRQRAGTEDYPEKNKRNLFSKVEICGVYLVVFCLPLYLVRLEIFSIPTNVLEIIIGALFIAWAINKIVNSEQRTANKNFKKLFIVHCLLFVAIALILIGVSVATIFSWDLRISAGIWKSWFVVPLLFFIIVIDTFKDRKKQIKNILFAFILSALVIGVISLVQWNLDSTGRLQGLYTSPNYLAMYLAPAWLICSYYFFTFLVAARGLTCGLGTRSKTIATKIFFLLCIILLSVILFFTKSLGAWLGIVVAVGFGLILYFYKIKKRKLFWVVIILGLIIVLILIYLKLNSEDGRISFNARLIIWQKALEVFKKYPLTGIGPGTFEDYFPPYPIWGVPQPHNLYLAFLIQTGIIGFVGFIWLLIHFFRNGLKLFIVHCSLFTILLIMVMVYILVHGLVDTTYWKNDLSVMFWMFIGLMTVLEKPQ